MRHEEDALWAAFALTFARKLAEQMKFRQRVFAHMRLVLLRFQWEDGWFDLARAIVLAVVLTTLTVMLINFARSNGPAAIAEAISEKSEKKSAAARPEVTGTESAKKPESADAKASNASKTPAANLITLLITIGGLESTAPSLS